MADSQITKRLFVVRIHPESAPHSIVTLLASSAQEAESVAREKTGAADAPATVTDCGSDDYSIVTLR